MCREPKDPYLLVLEKGAFGIVGNDWHSRLDRLFIENLGKFRKYDGRSVQDLLRALRNKVCLPPLCFTALFVNPTSCRNTITRTYRTTSSGIWVQCQRGFWATSPADTPGCSCMCMRSLGTHPYGPSRCLDRISSSWTESPLLFCYRTHARNYLSCSSVTSPSHLYLCPITCLGSYLLTLTPPILLLRLSLYVRTTALYGFFPLGGPRNFQQR
jgi:hypothetical protein